MTAAVLREAAKLMRSRAKNATDGPWFVPDADDEYVGPTDVVGDGEPGNRYIICEHAGMDAEHVASWHPLVALAVADLLSFAAEVWSEDDECRSPVGPDESCGECENCDHRWTRDRFVAVARAYLGGVS